MVSGFHSPCTNNTSPVHGILVPRGDSRHLFGWSTITSWFSNACLKKNYWRYWLQICTIRLLLVCSFSDSVYLPASHASAYAGLSLGNSCATSCFDVWLNPCLCFIAAGPRHLDALNHYIFLSQHVGLKYQWGLTSQLMFCAPQVTWNILDQVLMQKVLHKKCLLELIK